MAACPFPSARGTQARILAQANALLRLGVRVQVVTYHLSELDAPEALEVVRIPDVPTCRSLKPGPSLQKLLLLDPLLLARTFRVARRERPHVLHGHHVEGAGVALAVGRALGTPVVFDAHTSLAAELPTYRLPLPAVALRRLGRGLDALLARRCQQVVTVTESLREEFLRGAGKILSPERITVVPMMLDPATLPIDVAGRDPGRQQERARSVIYTGGLSGFQGLEILASAFEQVLAELPDARLEIVSPDAPEELEAVWPGVIRHGAVRFRRTSQLSEVFARLEAADVAVSPRSVPGGFPQKLLNYMRVGLPVVASAGSGEILRHGETGWVVPDRDPRRFAHAILELLRRPELRRRLGGAARDEVSRRYGAEGVARRLLGVYEAALAATGG